MEEQKIQPEDVRQDFELVAKTMRGLEDVLRDELVALGARDVEMVILDDSPAARAQQQSPGPVAAHTAPFDQHLGIIVVGSHHVQRLYPIGQGFGEGYFGVNLIEPPDGFHAAAGIGFDIVVVHQFEVHAGSDEIHTVLTRITPTQQQFVGPGDPLDGHIQPVNVRRIVFLVLEDAVDHANITAAVDIVRGIGRNAYHAPFAG